MEQFVGQDRNMVHSMNPTNKGVSKKNQITEFIRDAMPDNWLSYAEELEEAAELIWNSCNKLMSIDGNTTKNGKISLKKSSPHARTYILLAGLALENALKAIIITNAPSLISSGKLDKSLKSHKLDTLVKMIKVVELTDAENRVVKICQDAIPYWGRYPIPLQFYGLQPKEAATDDFRDTFRQLHYRLCKITYDMIKDGWDSFTGAKCDKIRSKRYGDEIDPNEPYPWITEKH
jgi:hypothetical protein